ncbi:hypothetical protein HK102_006816 [Quaeritorhiza haematococci]|nr:hypothetical protein HK102_006816 [Quaeritorhiza haematococci]
MDRTLFIITGASKGFGRSICLTLAESPLVTSHASDIIITGRDAHGLAATKSAILSVVSGTSRNSSQNDLTTDDATAGSATKHPVTVVEKRVDFSDPNMESSIEAVLSGVPAGVTYAKAFLFNNAGSLGKLSRVREQSVSDIKAAIDLNVTVPLALTSVFVKKFGSVCKRTTIVNVSSLAAVEPFDCWSVYCAGKAARDIFTRTVAIEESLIEQEEKQKSHSESPNGCSESEPSSPTHVRPRVTVLNYAPGPLDTDMQRRIRTEMPNVPTKEAYVTMHKEGQLVDPNDSAGVLVSLLEGDDFVNGAHVDYFDVKDQV